MPKLRRLSKKPAAVSKIGGSMKVTVPPEFFVLSGIDRDCDLEAETFYDGKHFIARIRPVPKA